MTALDRSIALAAHLRTIAGVADTPNAKTLREAADMLDLTRPYDIEIEAFTSNECVGCGGMPDCDNDPCGVCGKRAPHSSLASLIEERDRGTAALRAAFGEELWSLGHPAYVVTHLRSEHAKMERLWKDARAELDRLRRSPETECEPDAWMAEDGRVCTADLKRSQKLIMTAGFTIPLYRRAVKSEAPLTISKEPQ